MCVTLSLTILYVHTFVCVECSSIYCILIKTNPIDIVIIIVFHPYHTAILCSTINVLMMLFCLGITS